MLQPELLLVNWMVKRLFHTSNVNLKGHAKWQNIKHIKSANDALRQQLINRQLRIVKNAALEGGSPNPALNNALQTAISEALRRDVPKATIQTYLKKLAESKDTMKLQRQIFEWRLFKKLNIIIVIYTDNVVLSRNQMANLSKKLLPELTSVRRHFTERGVFNVILRPEITAENLEESCLSDAVECGAEDFEVFNAAERQATFFCDPAEFVKVKQKLAAAGHRIEHAECIFYPNIPLVQLTESETVEYKKFRNRLLEIDGFDEIYHNLEDNDDES